MNKCFSITGTVVLGKGEARRLGYPTANVDYALQDLTHAPDTGVWTCRVGLDRTTFNGLAVIGLWRLASDTPSLEVHLLDVECDLYGKRLSVAFELKLRDLIKFADIADLIAQIKKDIEQARLCFQAS